MQVHLGFDLSSEDFFHVGIKCHFSCNTNYTCGFLQARIGIEASANEKKWLTFKKGPKVMLFNL